MSSFREFSVLVCLVGAGCGGGVDDRPETAPVSGLLLKNGEAVAEARIEFIPENGASSSATTDIDGKFELVYSDGKPGAKVGTHQVRVTIGGTAMGTADGDSPKPPKKAPGQPMLYIISEPQSVSEGINELELELPKKGQPG